MSRIKNVISMELARKIYNEAKTKSIKELMEEYGLSYSSIRRIKNKEGRYANLNEEDLEDAVEEDEVTKNHIIKNGIEVIEFEDGIELIIPMDAGTIKVPGYKLLEVEILKDGKLKLKFRKLEE